MRYRTKEVGHEHWVWRRTTQFELQKKNRCSIVPSLWSSHVSTLLCLRFFPKKRGQISEKPRPSISSCGGLLHIVWVIVTGNVKHYPIQRTPPSMQTAVLHRPNEGKRLSVVTQGPSGNFWGLGAQIGPLLAEGCGPQSGMLHPPSGGTSPSPHKSGTLVKLTIANIAPPKYVRASKAFRQWTAPNKQALKGTMNNQTKPVQVYSQI